MGWTDELYKIYEYNHGINSDMLPIYHSTANAQIEITLNTNAELIRARVLDKSEAETIIPVTEDSSARGNGVTPMPFADKLVYIAGDYSDYATGKNADNSKYFKAYIEQLEKWKNSQSTHKTVQIVYQYLSKRRIMADLVECNILQIGDNGKLQDKIKIAGIDQADSFVRFVISNSIDNDANVNKSWKDPTLYKSFADFNAHNMQKKGLCYATGELLPLTEKHPSKIRNSGDKAKLFSSNDLNGFTYRGRFADSSEATSLSYDFSQKMHIALKWLIKRQSTNIGSMSLIVWASALQPLVDITSNIDDEELEEEFEPPTTLPAYAEKVEKCLLHYQIDLKTNYKIMIMALDSATTGRLSISMYDEMENTTFYQNLQKWYTDTAFIRYNTKNKRNEVMSFGLFEIIKYTYMNEQNDVVMFSNKFKDDVLSEIVLKLLPCIYAGKNLPIEIVNKLCDKASNPLAYNKDYNFRTVLEVACGMIRKYYIDHNKGEVTMSYDEKNTNRSYLYGCLLAIADKAESDTYDKDDKNVRVTNARRYWNSFSIKPYQTWRVIEERLRPYIDKLDGAKKVSYEIRMNDIFEKMSVEDFANNTKLEPLYLIGYHNYMSEMYKKTTDNEEK